MKIKLLLGLGILLAGVAARASNHTAIDTNHYAQLAREHVFMVDKDGICLDPAMEWGWTNVNDAKRGYTALSNSLQRINAGIREWKASQTVTDPNGPPRVVFFIHGGMNPYSSSQDRIRDTDFMDSLKASNCYPVFVVWNSGPFGALGEHLVLIRQGEKHPLMGALTSPFMLVSDLARGVARLPTTLCGRLYSDWQTTDMFGENTARERFERFVSTNQFQTYRPPQPGRLGGWKRPLEYFVTLPVKIVTLPLLDGLGTEAWDIMLRRTRTMFEPPGSYETADMIKKVAKDEASLEKNTNWISAWLHPSFKASQTPNGSNSQAGAMVYLCNELVDWTTDAAFTNLNFEFYGHSMGSIVLNQIFRTRPDINAKRIAYLAAACSIEDFKTALFPYLTAHTNTVFYSLSLHTLRERDEYPLAMLRVFFIRDLIVRGSLLNWIDDILAKPNSISDRTLGAWDNISRALPDVPEHLRGRTYFRGCDLEPDNTILESIKSGELLSPLAGKIEPQVHSDFPKAVFWSTNFLWPAGINQLELRKK